MIDYDKLQKVCNDKKIIIFGHDTYCTWLYLLDTNSSVEKNSKNIIYKDGCMLLNIIYSLC